MTEVKVDYIVDVSALIPNFITELYTENAQELFRQLAHGEVKLGIPEFGKIECLNVFWKQVRFEGMSEAQAIGLVSDLEALALDVFSVDEIYTEALQIGIKYQLAIYDSLYIALAKQLNYPLITLDQKQMQAAAQEHVTVTPLTNFVP